MSERLYRYGTEKGTNRIFQLVQSCSLLLAEKYILRIEGLPPGLSLDDSPSYRERLDIPCNMPHQLALASLESESDPVQAFSPIEKINPYIGSVVISYDSYFSTRKRRKIRGGYLLTMRRGFSLVNLPCPMAPPVRVRDTKQARRREVWTQNANLLRKDPEIAQIH